MNIRVDHFPSVEAVAARPERWTCGSFSIHRDVVPGRFVAKGAGDLEQLRAILDSLAEKARVEALRKEKVIPHDKEPES